MGQKKHEELLQSIILSGDFTSNKPFYNFRRIKDQGIKASSLAF
jgi:hypothetical protein